MPWIVLFFTLVVVLGFFIDSARLFIFGLLALLIKACPRSMFSTIGALILWGIKTNLRR